MLDPSKCLNFVLGADACVESMFDLVTVRSVAAYPTSAPVPSANSSAAGHVRGWDLWSDCLDEPAFAQRDLLAGTARSFWRFLRSYAASATRRMTDRARRCRPKNASGRRLLPFAKGCSRKTQTPRSIVKRGFPLSWRCCSGCCVSASPTGKFETRQSQARQATVSERTVIPAMQQRTPGNSLVL